MLVNRADSGFLALLKLLTPHLLRAAAAAEPTTTEIPGGEPNILVTRTRACGTYVWETGIADLALWFALLTENATTDGRKDGVF
jgi:hypothetical protein